MASRITNLYITIDDAHESGYTARLEHVGLPNHENDRREYTIERDRLDEFRELPAELSAKDLEWLGGVLLQTILEPAITPAILNAVRARTWDHLISLHLALGPAGLSSVPWELMAKPWPFTLGGGLALNVVRAFPPLEARPPVALPLRVLLASQKGYDSLSFDLPAALEQVFGKVAHAIPDAFDIGPLDWVPNNPDSVLRAGADIVHVTCDADGLRSLTELRPEGRLPRLLVVDVADEEVPPQEAVAAAHRLMRQGWLPALVLTHFPRTSDTPNLFYHRFYDAIVHDLPLDEAVFRARKWLDDHERTSWNLAACYLSLGAEDELRISPMAARIRQYAEELEVRAEAMHHTLERTTHRLRGSEAYTTANDASEFQHSLHDLTQRIRHTHEKASISTWDRESGGIVPLTEAARDMVLIGLQLERESARIADLEEVSRMAADRVVNTFFRDSTGDPVPRARPLAPARTYDFVVGIGPPLIWSNVEVPAPIPEVALAPFYVNDWLELQVSLFSDELKIDGETKPLRLPRSGPSGLLVFHIRTPAQSGAARLRACIYFRNNLIQSVLQSVHISEQPLEDGEVGNIGAVEFALTGTFDDIEQYPDRTLNLLLNERPGGSHTIAVAGSSIKRHFNLTEGQVRTAGKESRLRLLKAASELDAEQRPTNYRFDDENRGSEAMFVQDIKALARLGYTLFNRLLLSDGDPDFEEELRDALGLHAVIQVASTISAEYVVPWALFYDKRLVTDDANVVCETFLAALRAGGPPGILANQECIAHGCPHENDTNVICPSGFWGFKHIIEQPASVVNPGWIASDPPGSREPRSLVREITARGKPALVMAVNENLDFWSDHAAEVQKMRTLAFERRGRKAELQRVITVPELHVVYFYCHGRRRDEETWLGIGPKGGEDKLYSDDLRGWKVSWNTHPLVFINGCHTVDLNPDDLVSFLSSFAYCRAAGVIGTEIAVPELLARSVAVDFLEPFLRGEGSVGKIIRDIRLSLLEKYNPLGLAYTPYCSADLHLKVRESPTLDVLMLEARRSPEASLVDTEGVALEKVWTAAQLDFRIVSNDPRFGGSLVTKNEHLAALRSEWSRVLHLAVHGDATALGLEWSSEPDVGSRRITARLTPREIKSLDLSDTIVVSGACLSGRETLVEAFRHAGAIAYLSPIEEVEWPKLIPYFEALYGALAQGRTVGESMAAAGTAVPEMGVLYQDRIGDGSARLVTAH